MSNAHPISAGSLRSRSRACLLAWKGARPRRVGVRLSLFEPHNKSKPCLHIWPYSAGSFPSGSHRTYTRERRRNENGRNVAATSNGGTEAHA